ncbi:MAG: hypothetical protein OXU75_02290 [Deltaproteobacteria bacterium]|nr:hypothetical protein [Deltaproteobacteria bacterium]
MNRSLNPATPSRVAARTMRHAAIAITAAILAVTSLSTGGAAEMPATTSPYAGQENRPIKSLSAEDLAELRRGGGWGLARAAELNGMPGPAHLLELKDRIPLTADQVTAISAIFKDMRAAAIAEGERLISREEALETVLRNGSVTVRSLQELLSEIGQARTALRYVHLAAHLKTLPLLTHDQIARYNVLRGYAGDPCASPPEGHDVSMWRKHNGCD